MDTLFAGTVGFVVGFLVGVGATVRAWMIEADVVDARWAAEVAAARAERADPGPDLHPAAVYGEYA